MSESEYIILKAEITIKSMACNEKRLIDVRW